MLQWQMTQSPGSICLTGKSIDLLIGTLGWHLSIEICSTISEWLTALSLGKIMISHHSRVGALAISYVFSDPLQIQAYLCFAETPQLRKRCLATLRWKTRFPWLWPYTTFLWAPLRGEMRLDHKGTAAKTTAAAASESRASYPPSSGRGKPKITSSFSPCHSRQVCCSLVQLSNLWWMPNQNRSERVLKTSIIWLLTFFL